MARLADPPADGAQLGAQEARVHVLHLTTGGKPEFLNFRDTTCSGYEEAQKEMAAPVCRAGLQGGHGTARMERLQAARLSHRALACLLARLFGLKVCLTATEHATQPLTLADRISSPIMSSAAVRRTPLTLSCGARPAAQQPCGELNHSMTRQNNVNTNQSQSIACRAHGVSSPLATCALRPRPGRAHAQLARHACCQQANARARAPLPCIQRRLRPLTARSTRDCRPARSSRASGSMWAGA